MPKIGDRDPIRGTLVALVVPDDFLRRRFGAEAAEQRTKGLVREPANYLMNLLHQVGENSNTRSFAHETVDYEIVR